MENLMQAFATEWQSIVTLIALVSAIVHIIFAGAVARDAGKIAKAGIATQLVSPMTWAFATLVGGVAVAAIYWFMHHVNFARHFYPPSQKITSLGADK